MAESENGAPESAGRELAERTRGELRADSGIAVLSRRRNSYFSTCTGYDRTT